MRRRHLILALLMLPVACTGPQAPPATGGATGDGAIALSQRCTHAGDGFSVSYPAGWQTNSGAVIPACSAFHPDPFEIPEASEMPFEIAVTIGVQPVDIGSFRAESPWEEILSAERLTIGGREAWRIEARSTGEGLAERGMRTLRYAIDLGEGRTLLASTHDANPGYEAHQEVLARMVASVELPR